MQRKDLLAAADAAHILLERLTVVAMYFVHHEPMKGRIMLELVSATDDLERALRRDAQAEPFTETETRSESVN